MVVLVEMARQNREVREFYEAVGYGGRPGENEVVIVARDGGRIVGAARICQEEGAHVLRGMQVAPERQRSGIGTRLLEAAVAHLGIRCCWCLPYDFLEDFYARAGFRSIPPDELPTFLAMRRDSYLAAGLHITPMLRP